VPPPTPTRTPTPTRGYARAEPDNHVGRGPWCGRNNSPGASRSPVVSPPARPAGETPAPQGGIRRDDPLPNRARLSGVGCATARCRPCLRLVVQASCLRGGWGEYPLPANLRTRQSTQRRKGAEAQRQTGRHLGICQRRLTTRWTSVFSPVRLGLATRTGFSSRALCREDVRPVFASLRLCVESPIRGCELAPTGTCTSQSVASVPQASPHTRPEAGTAAPQWAGSAPCGAGILPAGWVGGDAPGGVARGPVGTRLVARQPGRPRHDEAPTVAGTSPP